MASVRKRILCRMNINAMRSTAAHRCPICAGNMQLNSVLPITFWGGGSNYMLKYVCDKCHVEMNRTEKTLRPYALKRNRQSERAGDRAA